MSYLINFHPSGGWFRWFDCGDLQGLWMLVNVVEVCRNTPSISHWLPTHEPFVVAAYLDKYGEFPDNLCVRISADYVEDRPTTPTWGLPTHTVHRWKDEPVPAADGDRKKSIACMSYKRGNKCDGCRACWSRKVQNVSLPVH